MCIMALLPIRTAYRTESVQNSVENVYKSVKKRDKMKIAHGFHLNGKSEKKEEFESRMEIQLEKDGNGETRTETSFLQRGPCPCFFFYLTAFRARFLIHPGDQQLPVYTKSSFSLAVSARR